MKKKITIFFVLSVIYIIFFPMLKNNVLDKDYYVQFTVDGSRNGASNGTEIWITNIYADGKPYDMSKIYVGDSDWTYDGRLFNAGTDSSVLETKIKYKDTLEIEFIAHPYSGVVQVTNMSETKTVDLYSSEEGKISCIFER